MTLKPELPAMHILVADDNDANCLVARTILERSHHKVVTAEHGLQALKLTEKTEFDLIILDILMPVMDGLAALETIRNSQTQNENTPIFALTAYCDTEDRKRYAAAGFDAVLSKPLRHGDLEAAFRQYRSRSTIPLSQSYKIHGPLEVPLLDVQTISMLMNFGNPERLSEIQSRFWASVHFKCGVIKSSLPDALEGDGAQLSEFRRAVHALKGASASIGLARVADICRDLRNAPPAHIPGLIASLVAALKASRPALNEALSGTRELNTSI